MGIPLSELEHFTKNVLLDISFLDSPEVNDSIIHSIIDKSF
jgi:hypothetical protein